MFKTPIFTLWLLPKKEIICEPEEETVGHAIVYPAYVGKAVH